MRRPNDSMDPVKITELPAASTPSGSEHVPLVQGGETKRSTVAAVRGPNVPTAQQKAALAGSHGTPGASNPYVTGSDPRLPTADEKAALAGTEGSPSAENPFVTEEDSRLPTPEEKASFANIPTSAERDRIPSVDIAAALAGSFGTPSASNRYVTEEDGLLPSFGQKNALVGTAGTPSDLNPYVTDADERLPTVEEKASFENIPSSAERARIPNADTFAALAGTAGTPDDENRFVTDADARLPSADEKAALAGSGATAPSTDNRFVVEDDPQLERIPSAGEKAALAGSAGTPGAGNRYLTEEDSRRPTAGEKAALAGTEGTPGAENLYVTNADPRLVPTATQARIPTADEKGALEGTHGTPSASNPFVTDSDPRLEGGGGAGDTAELLGAFASVAALEAAHPAEDNEGRLALVFPDGPPTWHVAVEGTWWPTGSPIENFFVGYGTDSSALPTANVFRPDAVGLVVDESEDLVRLFRLSGTNPVTWEEVSFPGGPDIDELPQADTLAGTEPLAILQGGELRRTTVQEVANLAPGGGDVGELYDERGMVLVGSTAPGEPEKAAHFGYPASVVAAVASVELADPGVLELHVIAPEREETLELELPAGEVSAADLNDALNALPDAWRLVQLSGWSPDLPRFTVNPRWPQSRQAQYGLRVLPGPVQAAFGFSTRMTWSSGAHGARFRTVVSEPFAWSSDAADRRIRFTAESNGSPLLDAVVEWEQTDTTAQLLADRFNNAAGVNDAGFYAFPMPDGRVEFIDEFRVGIRSNLSVNGVDDNHTAVGYLFEVQGQGTVGGYGARDPELAGGAGGGEGGTLLSVPLVGGRQTLSGSWAVLGAARLAGFVPTTAYLTAEARKDSDGEVQVELIAAEPPAVPGDSDVIESLTFDGEGWAGTTFPFDSPEFELPFEPHLFHLRVRYTGSGSAELYAASLVLLLEL